MTALPVPTLDHVVINVGPRMDEAVALFTRLGFTLTPRGYHTLGSINHLAMFGTDYLELVGYEPGATRVREEIRDAPIGLNGIVFGTEDALGVHRALQNAGVPVQAASDFSRPVTIDGATRDARFRTVRLTPDTAPYARLYFCQHFTRDLVWRDEWRRHANGVVGVSRIVLRAADPAATAALYAKMFGADFVRPIEGGISLCMGLGTLDILSPAAARARYGTGLLDLPESPVLAVAVEFHVPDSAKARRAFHATAVERATEANQVLIRASDAFGVTLLFEDD